MGALNSKCPVKGCTNVKASYQLTCVIHWRKVPRATQAKVYKLFREAPGSPEQRSTCFSILNILNEGIPEGSKWP
jgi:hypothetical protein